MLLLIIFVVGTNSLDIYPYSCRWLTGLNSNHSRSCAADGGLISGICSGGSCSNGEIRKCCKPSFSNTSYIDVPRYLLACNTKSGIDGEVAKCRNNKVATAACISPEKCYNLKLFHLGCCRWENFTVKYQGCNQIWGYENEKLECPQGKTIVDYCHSNSVSNCTFAYNNTAHPWDYSYRINVYK